jgi:hypothetical protein
LCKFILQGISKGNLEYFMMTMFRNLTTFLMGSNGEDQAASAQGSEDFDQIEDVEEDWIFVQNANDASGDANNAKTPPPGEKEENKENGEELEWANRLIEHPSMSVYKSITFMEMDDEIEPEPVQEPTPIATLPLTPSNNNNKRRPKSNNLRPQQQQPQLVDYLQPNQNSAHFRGKISAYRKAEAILPAPNSRKQKYKNGKGNRMNNDRKCGCKNFV